jgi:hypothetical protein
MPDMTMGFALEASVEAEGGREEVIRGGQLYLLNKHVRPTATRLTTQYDS